MTQEGSCKIRYYFETGEELERFMKEAEKLKKDYKVFQVTSLEIEDKSVLPYFEAHLSVYIENNRCEYQPEEGDVGVPRGMMYVIDAYEVKDILGKEINRLSFYPYDDEIIEEDFMNEEWLLAKYEENKYDLCYD